MIVDFSSCGGKLMLVDFKARVVEYFTKELGHSIKHMSLEPSNYVNPLYRVVILDDDYAMAKVIDFTEYTCKFTMHSKSAIHHTSDMSYEWQLFNIKKTTDINDRIALVSSYLDFCDKLLDERIKDFVDYLPTLPEFQTALEELTELCNHFWTLGDKNLKDRVTLIKTHKDEIQLETDIRCSTMAFSNKLNSAIDYIKSSNTSVITEQEQAELIEEIQELKDRNDFNGNHLLYKMDTALGYIGEKAQE